jgi:RNA polymerase-associated protein LEO1
LEYEEEEVPPELAIEVKEAEVTFPNLPVPKSSDGDVSFLYFSRKHESSS